MRIESKLCHVSENKAIVQVNGWVNDKNQGSALAEGLTVEEAEDKADNSVEEPLDLFATDVAISVEFLRCSCFSKFWC